MSKLSVTLSDSIGTRLMATVFSFYMIVTISVTLFHMGAEFYNTRQQIRQDLTSFAYTFANGIAAAVWNVDNEQLEATINGILKSSFIEGVRIKTEVMGELHYGRTLASSELDNQLNQLNHLHQASDLDSTPEAASSDRLFQSEIPLIFTLDEDDSFDLGTLTLYSSHSVVFRKVQNGFTIILINSLIKSIALWGIFLFFSRRLLSHPLAQLTEATAKLNLTELENLRVRIHTKGNNELKLLEEAFNSMIEKLLHARKALDNSMRFLSRANSRLKDIVHNSKAIVSSNNKFFPLVDSINAILHHLNWQHPQRVTFLFRENSRSTRGFVCFEVPVNRSVEQALRLKLDRLKEVHLSYAEAPAQLDDPDLSLNDPVQVKQMLKIPLNYGGKLQGAIIFDGLDTAQFREEDRDFVSTVVQFLAIYMQNHEFTLNLERKVQERTAQLQSAMQQLENQHETLKRTQSHLVQSEKLAGLGTLVAGVAHEINNPTNFVHLGIKSLEKDIAKQKDFLLDLLEEEPEILETLQQQYDPIEGALKDVSDGSERIKTIVMDLRAFSRLQQAERKTSEVISGLESTLRIIRTQYKKHVQFETDFQANPVFNCWPAKLNQAFMNLIVNACQAVKERYGDDSMGTVRVSSREERVEGAPHLVLEIQDNGCGMDESTMSRVFDPFFTTKPVGQGTGLGMSITYGILQEHQGKIDIQSKVDEGTLITLKLPLTTQG